MPHTHEVAECPNCGVIVSKIKAREDQESVPGQFPGSSTEEPAKDYLAAGAGTAGLAATASAEPAEYPEHPYQPEEEAFVPEPRHLDGREAALVLGAAALALILMAFPFTGWILSVFVILIHEMGHTIFGWLFGYPSLPAFDVVWGGGLTLHIDRSSLLIAAIYVMLGLLIYSYRKNTATVVFLLLVGALHAVLNFTKGHSVVILFMGHGTELAIAGLFIYRALSGRAILHSAERPLYALLGFFVVFFDLAFAFKLLSSHAQRIEYSQAKGGDIEMDFVQIAADYIHVGLKPIVTFFFICCVLTPILAYLAFRYEQYIHSVIVRLWVRDPKEPAGHLGRG